MDSLQKKFFWVCISISMLVTFVVLNHRECKMFEIDWIYTLSLLGCLTVLTISFSIFDKEWQNLGIPWSYFKPLFSYLSFWGSWFVVTCGFIEIVYSLDKRIFSEGGFFDGINFSLIVVVTIFFLYWLYAVVKKRLK